MMLTLKRKKGESNGISSFNEYNLEIASTTLKVRLIQGNKETSMINMSSFQIQFQLTYITVPQHTDTVKNSRCSYAVLTVHWTHEPTWKT